jgi:hypothetical protein
LAGLDREGRTVPDVAHFYATVDEVAMGFLDIGNDECTFSRTGCGRDQAVAKSDRGRSDAEVMSGRSEQSTSHNETESPFFDDDPDVLWTMEFYTDEETCDRHFGDPVVDETHEQCSRLTCACLRACPAQRLDWSDGFRVAKGRRCDLCGVGVGRSLASHSLLSGNSSAILACDGGFSAALCRGRRPDSDSRVQGENRSPRKEAVRSGRPAQHREWRLA